MGKKVIEVEGETFLAVEKPPRAEKKRFRVVEGFEVQCLRGLLRPGAFVTAKDFKGGANVLEEVRRLGALG